MAHRAQTDRAEIVRTATALLADHGLRGVSIRAVARTLGLAPNAIYSHVASLEALLNAVAADVCATLLEHLESACRGVPPEGAVRALAAAYLAFADDRRSLYEALLLPRPAGGDDALAPERLWTFVVTTVAGVSGEAEASTAAVALWATLHGIASLESTRAFEFGKPRAGIGFALDAWFDAARAASRREPLRAALR